MPLRILTFALLILAHTGLAQQSSVLGKWKTIDDSSGEERSIVELYERDGKVFGRIIKLFRAPEDDPDPLCEECSEDDARYKKKIIGMEIMQEMTKSGEEYTDGKILDPESGKIYGCKIWLDGEVLKVRGYWGPFYRTQSWNRVN